MYEEMKRLMKELGVTFEDFKSANNARVDELFARLEQVENAGVRIGSLGPGDEPANPEYTKAFETWIRSAGNDEHARQQLGMMQKDVTIGDNNAGGYAVPKEIENQIAKRIVDISPFLAIVKRVQTETSDYHHLVNVNGATSGWVGEGDTRNATSTPQLEDVEPTWGTVYSYPAASEESILDIQFDVASWLVDNVVEDHAKEIGASIVSGNGTNKPTGFLNTTPVSTGDADSPARAFGTLQYIPTGVAGGFPVQSVDSPPSGPGDILYNTIYSLRQGYRQNAVWAMNSSTAGVMRKWKDQDGRYLWTDNLIQGQPSLLCGYPVVVAEDMPDIGANTHPVAFGDFMKGYVFAEQGGLRITVDPSITTPGTTKWYVRRRVAGKTLDDHAIRMIKCAVS